MFWWGWLISLTHSPIWYFSCSEHGGVWSVSICRRNSDKGAENGAQCCFPFTGDGCEGGFQVAVRDRPSCPYSRDWSGWAFIFVVGQDATGCGAFIGLFLPRNVSWDPSWRKKSASSRTFLPTVCSMGLPLSCIEWTFRWSETSWGCSVFVHFVMSSPAVSGLAGSASSISSSEVYHEAVPDFCHGKVWSSSYVVWGIRLIVACKSWVRGGHFT